MRLSALQNGMLRTVRAYESFACVVDTDAKVLTSLPTKSARNKRELTIRPQETPVSGLLYLAKTPNLRY